MLNFPANPGTGDVYSNWTWDGEKWTTAGSAGSFLPLIGGIITGNLGVQGITTLNTLTATGAATFNGNATVHGTLSAVNNAVVGGNILVNGNQRTLGDAEIVGDLDLTGDADFGRNLTVAMDADIGGDLDVAGSANIAQNLTVGGDTDIAGTLNALGNVDVTGILTLSGDPTANLQAATKRYVDEAIAAQMLWQGTWDADNNLPDLTDTALQVNGYTWSITTPDPTQPFTIPATPAIPGLSGVTVYNGDHVVWSDVANEFQITQGSSLSLQEAQDMFVELAGDTMTGPLTISGAHNLTVGQDIIGQRDLTLTRDLTAGRNLAITGTSTLLGNTTIGVAATPADVDVFGSVDVRDYVQVHNELYVYKDAQLAMQSGGVEIGQAANNPSASLEVAGETYLAHASGNVNLGDAANPTMRVIIGVPTGPPVTSANTVNSQGDYYVNGEIVITNPALPGRGIIQNRGGIEFYQSAAGTNYREVCQIRNNASGAPSVAGIYVLPLSASHGNAVSNAFVRRVVFALGNEASVQHFRYRGDLNEFAMDPAFGRVWIRQDDTDLNLWHVAVQLGQFQNVSVGVLSPLMVRGLPAPTVTYSNINIPAADITAADSAWILCDPLTAIHRGPFRISDPVVSAAAFPTTPNLAADPPVVGMGWTPATGGTATSTYTHAAGTNQPLAWPVTIESGNWYQIVFTSTNTNANLSTQTQWFLRNGPTNNVGQQLVRASNLGSTTNNVLATADFTHLVAQPMNDWEGALTLTRVTRRAATTAALENSETLRLKTWRTIIRGDNSRYDGTGGRIAAGANNTAFGWNAMEDTTTGADNTAFGFGTLQNNVGGAGNTAIGRWALTISNGSNNVAVGLNAMRDNTVGSNNVAVGGLALASAGAQSGNIAVGYAAQELNCLGNGNVAVGFNALRANQNGSCCTAIGHQTLAANLALNNSAFGYRAQQSNTYGSANTAVGYYALNANTWGNGNVAVGHNALALVVNHWNTAVGQEAGKAFGAAGTSNNTNSTHGTFIGSDARPLAAGSQSEIVIGSGAVGGGNYTVTIGNTSMTGTHRTNVAWTTFASDARLKDDIALADLDKCLATVKALPVKRWAWSDFVGSRVDRHETGWVADDVEQVFPKSVAIADLLCTGGVLKDAKSHNVHHQALPTLWGAVQRLVERIEELERRHG